MKRSIGAADLDTDTMAAKSARLEEAADGKQMVVQEIIKGEGDAKSLAKELDKVGSTAR